MPLSEEKRKVLDSGIKTMVESGASQEDIMAYAKDFNNKLESIRKKLF